MAGELSSPERWAALGAALLAGKQPAAAIGPLRRAVELRPHDGAAWSQLGDALRLLGRLEEARSCYEEATAHDPQSSAAWYGLGRVYLERDRPAGAAAAFERCSTADPAALHEHGKALFQLGCVERAMPLLRRAATATPDDMKAQALENLAIIAPGSPDDDNRSVLETRRRWAQRLAARPPRPARHRNGPLRIGYVSCFFHRPNWMKPVWALINRHDRERVEVHLFSDAPAERVQGGYRPDPRDRFHDISGQPNEAAADAIATADVDVLVDLNGYSAVRRLGLYPLRPAPLVIGWFNSYATSGLDCFDYLIGDEHVIPPAEEPYYVERIVRVPSSYLTFEVDHPAPDVAMAPILAAGRMTIGCLASQYKITDQVVRTWAEILRRCPETRLLIRNATLGPAETRDHLAGRFAGCGIGRDRLLLEGPAGHFDFLGTYDRVDFAVDPFPYSGGTTTMEALWQGVPVVTFDGDRWASRTSVSLLRAAGLGEFVAGSLQEYVELCVRLSSAADTPDRLQAFRAGIRERLRASPVCDAATFARNMEALYLRLWEETLGRR
jgi:predicted O-linked N-acetylglucosamine transferase (SPINDLY family)